MNAKRFLIGWGGLALFFLLGMLVVDRIPLKDARLLLLHPVAGDGLNSPGDYYLMMQYDVGSIDLSRVESDGARFSSGEPVCVVLDRADGRARAVRVLRAPPDRGLFLRGVVADWTPERMSVLYGVESFAIPDNRRAEYDAFPRPFEVRIRIDERGTARVTALAAGEKTLPISL
jgi:hypothetical protein